MVPHYTHIACRVRRLVAPDNAEVRRALDVVQSKDLRVLDAHAPRAARLAVGTDSRLHRVKHDVVGLVADAVDVDLPALCVSGSALGTLSGVFPLTPDSRNPPRRSTS